MAHETVSLLRLILRVLIAAAIAGMLTLCSLAIERTKKFFKLSNGADIHKIIGTGDPSSLTYRRCPIRTMSISPPPHCEQTSRQFQVSTEVSAVAGSYLGGIGLDLMAAIPAPHDKATALRTIGSAVAGK